MQTDEIEVTQVVATLDPNCKFPTASQQQLLEACGIIPTWINPLSEETYEDQAKNGYQFPAYTMEGTINEEGIYVSSFQGSDEEPADPDLYPLLKMERIVNGKSEAMYQYQYGIVAFVCEGADTVIYRMD